MNRLWELTAVALVAQLITFPLGVFYFHQFPTYFLLANPIVIVMSEMLLPLAMATLAFSWVRYLNDVWAGYCRKRPGCLTSRYANRAAARCRLGWLVAFPICDGADLYRYFLWRCAVTDPNRAYIWATSVAALLLAGVIMWDDYEQAHQQRLAVHFLPHRTAVSLTNGHQSLLLTDLDAAIRAPSIST